MNPDAVFVYGLLKPGFRLHHVIAPYVERVAQATAGGRLYDAGVPAARFGPGGTVHGFVVWLRRPSEALRVLDELEDEGTVYRRLRVRAELDDGGHVDAWAYEYVLDVTRRREVGGVWT